MINRRLSHISNEINYQEYWEREVIKDLEKRGVTYVYFYYKLVKLIELLELCGIMFEYEERNNNEINWFVVSNVNFRKGIQ
jgi:hypothetical protein